VPLCSTEAHGVTLAVPRVGDLSDVGPAQRVQINDPHELLTAAHLQVSHDLDMSETIAPAAKAGT
jgi:hypothetical protein